MSNILVDKADKIVTITLNKPEHLNAIDRDMGDEIIETLDKYGNDPSVHVFIIKGAGRAFSAGGDIHPSHIGGTAPVEEDTVEFYQRMRRTHPGKHDWKIWDTPQPVIAQVHGYCLGVGFVMAMACDLVVVAENARLGAARLAIGAVGLSPIMVWNMGLRRAKWIEFLIGWRMSGKEAVDWGVANLAVPPEKLEEEVQDLAQTLASYPLSTLKVKKYALNGVWEGLGVRSSYESIDGLYTIANKSKTGKELANRRATLGFKDAFAFYDEYPRRHGHNRVEDKP